MQQRRANCEFEDLVFDIEEIEGDEGGIAP